MPAHFASISSPVQSIPAYGSVWMTSGAFAASACWYSRYEVPPSGRSARMNSTSTFLPLSGNIASLMTTNSHSSTGPVSPEPPVSAEVSPVASLVASMLVTSVLVVTGLASPLVGAVLVSLADVASEPVSVAVAGPPPQPARTRTSS